MYIYIYEIFRIFVRDIKRTYFFVVDCTLLHCCKFHHISSYDMICIYIYVYTYCCVLPSYVTVQPYNLACFEAQQFWARKLEYVSADIANNHKNQSFVEG